MRKIIYWIVLLINTTSVVVNLHTIIIRLAQNSWQPSNWLNLFFVVACLFIIIIYGISYTDFTNYEDYKVIKGRYDFIFELKETIPCCEWINKVLKEWSITSDKFKLQWHIYGTEDDIEDNQFINNVKIEGNKNEQL